jgi:hypothetical protein
MAKETTTRFDLMYFKLACGHPVVLGRLDEHNSWKCETCGEATDLRAEPYRTELEHDRDVAEQVDKHARERGEALVRADRSDPPRPEW